MKLVECVPNFSEGCDAGVIATIRDAIAAVAGVSVLHVTADRSHNRSVITFAGDYDAVAEAAFAAVRTARDVIDLTRHTGVHPRIGAADVVPFVPLDGATMEDCVVLARAVGERVGRELSIPVYLYEHAAMHPARRRLADIRRGGFEGLRTAIAGDPARHPDFGPLRLHPTAGAVAIGARPFLVAYNVYVGGASQLGVAREIARVVRESGGGLPGVRALGLEVAGEAQVSMNLTDLERTTLADALEAVEREAAARGAGVSWSEVIGLVPERVVMDVAERRLRLRAPLADHVLERLLLAHRLRRSSPMIGSYLDALATGAGTPGGGSAAALAGALAAALSAMVANLTLARERFAAVHPEMSAIAAEAAALAASLERLREADATAFARLVDARSRAAGGHGMAAVAVQDALRAASEIPRDVALLAARAAVLCRAVAERGNPNARPDAGVGALLAHAAARGALYNVLANAAALADRAVAAALEQAARGAARDAAAAAEQVDALLGGARG